jgi:hypothetical protein
MGLEKLIGLANFYLWKDKMMIFFSIYNLKSFIKQSNTQLDPSNTKTKQIESWNTKSKTMKFILYHTVNSSIKSILYTYIIGLEGQKVLYKKYDKRNSITIYSLLKAIRILKCINQNDIPNYIIKCD